MSGCLDHVECQRPEWCEIGEKRNAVASIAAGILVSCSVVLSVFLLIFGYVWYRLNFIPLWEWMSCHTPPLNACYCFNRASFGRACIFLQIENGARASKCTLACQPRLFVVARVFSSKLTMTHISDVPNIRYAVTSRPFSKWDSLGYKKLWFLLVFSECL